MVLPKSDMIRSHLERMHTLRYTCQQVCSWNSKPEQKNYVTRRPYMHSLCCGLYSTLFV